MTTVAEAALFFICPVCKAPVKGACVTTITRRPTSTHARRTALGSAWILGESSRDAEIFGLRTDILTLQNDVSALNAERTDLEHQVSTLTATNTAAQQRITALTTSITDLHDQVTQAQADLAKEEADAAKVIADLRAQIAAVDPAFHPVFHLPVWRDEFDQPDGPPLNFNVRGSEMGELQDAGVIDSSLARVENKTLHLRADWLPLPIPRKTPGWTTKSAVPGVTAAVATPGGTVNKIVAITHRNSYVDHEARPRITNKPGRLIYEQAFGRWVFGFHDLPIGPLTRGAMPALWLRDDQAREIDVMEAIGGGGTMPADWTSLVKDTGKTTVFSNTSTGAGKLQKRWRDEGHCPAVLSVGAHEVAFTLLPAYAAIDVDGSEILRWTPATAPQFWGPDPANHPLHLRMNLHVGEYFGVPDPAHREWTKPLDFPIDYVRIYGMPTGTH